MRSGQPGTGFTRAESALLFGCRFGIYSDTIIGMTYAMSVRLDEETARQLDDLVSAGHTSKASALQEAIHVAWRELQYRRLEEGYAAIAAENPHYPFESAEDAAIRRKRRAERERRRAGL
jgi:predicted transcriptional regulator